MTIKHAQLTLKEFNDYNWEGHLKMFILERIWGDNKSLLGRSIRARQTGEY